MSLFPEKLLSIAREFSFARGARLVRQGEPARGAFFIGSGSVAAEVALPGGGMLAVAELGDGEMFGEMALIERGLCSASVVAKTDVRGWFVGREDFRALVASRDAEALEVQRAVTRVLAAKLRALNEKVRQHPAEEDRPPRGEPQVDLSKLQEPTFEWAAFLPLLRFFEGFHREEIDELAALGRPLAAPKSTWLFGAGQPAASSFLVVRGAVEVLSRQGALERRVTIAGPGELVGYLAVLDRAKHAAQRRACARAPRCSNFRAATFLEVYQGASGLSVRLQHAIQRSLLRSLARTNSQLTRLISRGAPARRRSEELETACTHRSWRAQPDRRASRAGAPTTWGRPPRISANSAPYSGSSTHDDGVPGQRLRGDEDRVGVLGAAGHLPLAVVQRVVAAERVPERQEAQVRLVHARGILGAVAAEVEAVAHRGELAAVGDEEVDRGRDGDAERLRARRG